MWKNPTNRVAALLALIIWSAYACVGIFVPSAEAAMRSGPSIKVSNTITNNNMIAVENGYAVDSGVSIETIQAAAAATNVNVSGVIEAINISEKGQPNGLAGLDENGKIDAELVETITIVFAGGKAVDVQ